MQSVIIVMWHIHIQVGLALILRGSKVNLRSWGAHRPQIYEVRHKAGAQGMGNGIIMQTDLFIWEGEGV